MSRARALVFSSGYPQDLSEREERIPVADEVVGVLDDGHALARDAFRTLQVPISARIIAWAARCNEIAS